MKNETKDTEIKEKNAMSTTENNIDVLQSMAVCDPNSTDPIELADVSAMQHLLSAQRQFEINRCKVNIGKLSVEVDAHFEDLANVQFTPGLNSILNHKYKEIIDGF